MQLVFEPLKTKTIQNPTRKISINSLFIQKRAETYRFRSFLCVISLLKQLR